jgi:hypothetical protein
VAYADVIEADPLPFQRLVVEQQFNRYAVLPIRPPHLPPDSELPVSGYDEGDFERIRILPAGVVECAIDNRRTCGFSGIKPSAPRVP